jgi:hypothetical protein
MQRTFAAHTPALPFERFTSRLASHQDPRFLTALGHAVEADAPAGEMSGLVRVPESQPVRQSRQSVPRQAGPRPSAQRLTDGGTPVIPAIPDDGAPSETGDQPDDVMGDAGPAAPAAAESAGVSHHEPPAVVPTVSRVATASGLQSVPGLPVVPGFPDPPAASVAGPSASSAVRSPASTPSAANAPSAADSAIPTVAPASPAPEGSGASSESVAAPAFLPELVAEEDLTPSPAAPLSEVRGTDTVVSRVEEATASTLGVDGMESQPTSLQRASGPDTVREKSTVSSHVTPPQAAVPAAHIDPVRGIAPVQRQAESFSPPHEPALTVRPLGLPSSAGSPPARIVALQGPPASVSRSGDHESSSPDAPPHSVAVPVPQVESPVTSYAKPDPEPGPDVTVAAEAKQPAPSPGIAVAPLLADRFNPPGDGQSTFPPVSNATPDDSPETSRASMRAPLPVQLSPEPEATHRWAPGVSAQRPTLPAMPSAPEAPSLSQQQQFPVTTSGLPTLSRSLEPVVASAQVEPVYLPPVDDDQSPTSSAGDTWSSPSSAPAIPASAVVPTLAPVGPAVQRTEFQTPSTATTSAAALSSGSSRALASPLHATSPGTSSSRTAPRTAQRSSDTPEPLPRRHTVVVGEPTAHAPTAAPLLSAPEPTAMSLAEMFDPSLLALSSGVSNADDRDSGVLPSSTSTPSGQTPSFRAFPSLQRSPAKPEGTSGEAAMTPGLPRPAAEVVSRHVEVAQSRPGDEFPSYQAERVEAPPAGHLNLQRASDLVEEIPPEIAADIPADNPAPPATGVPPTMAPPPSAQAPLPTDLDELARVLYEPLSARIRAELWLDRERAGLLTEPGR